MKAAYCQYCGQPLSERCDCAREAAQAQADFIEEYENRPETQAGWAFQDLVDMHRRER